MTNLQRKILKYIAKKLVKQGHTHAFNIIQYYDIIKEAAINEFIEDNDPTTKAFLTECFNTSLGENNTELHLNIPEQECSNYDNYLGTPATERYEAEMNREPTLMEKVQQWFEDYKQEKAKITIMHYTDITPKRRKEYEPCPLCHNPLTYNETNNTIVCIPCNGSRNATNAEIIDHCKDQ